MEIDETTFKMNRCDTPVRKLVQTTMLADRHRSKTRDDHKTMSNAMNVAQVQTMRFIEVGDFRRSTAAGNTWWMTGVAII